MQDTTAMKYLSHELYNEWLGELVVYNGDILKKLLSQIFGLFLHGDCSQKLQANKLY